MQTFKIVSVLVPKKKIYKGAYIYMDVAENLVMLPEVLT